MKTLAEKEANLKVQSEAIKKDKNRNVVVNEVSKSEPVLSQTDENLSYIPSVPMQNQFHVLSQPWLDENPISPVTTSQYPTSSSLNTITTTTTSSSLVASSLDNTASLAVDRAMARAMAKNDEMKEALLKKFDEMIKRSES